MQIFNDEKKRIGTLMGVRNREITKTLDSGDKEITFEYPVRGEMADYLKEEYYIRTKDDEFVIKATETSGEYNKYTAVLNVEELEGQSFPYGFISHEQTIRACLEFAFEGTGWKVGNCTVTKKRTINKEESATAWDILQDCLKTYRCECSIDSINKQVNIYEQIGQDRGCYFVEGLNLRELTAQSDTYEFYTRIVPLGKDGITIEWLHGKEYLENYQYSKKIKTYTWKDERYTNTTSLMEDAAEKLEELSKPYKVYSADVADLAEANPEYKNILDYGIGDTVRMVSRSAGIREKQRIVKIVEYPESPEKNTVELSNTTKTFAEVQKTETELAKTEAIYIANSTTKKILTDYSTTQEIETKITASKEAIELSVSEKYQTIDAMGDYSTTSEMNAAIKLNADAIALEVSKKVGADEIISKINQSAESIDIEAGKINLNGIVTANQNFRILEDGSMQAKNGKFEGTITGSVIQTSETGKRAVIDTSSALKGYDGGQIYNILDMASEGNEIQMTMDAKNQLTIRTPKLAVINQSYGTESGQAKVTKTGDIRYVSGVTKNYNGCSEMWVNNVYCTLPVFLNVQYTSFSAMLGMLLTGETTTTNRV
ncbi:phage tail spike protein [Eisenbergiella sp.]